jgi:hypothetical protein
MRNLYTTFNTLYKTNNTNTKKNHYRKMIISDVCMNI